MIVFFDGVHGFLSGTREDEVEDIQKVSITVIYWFSVWLVACLNFPGSAVSDIEALALCLDPKCDWHVSVYLKDFLGSWKAG